MPQPVVRPTTRPISWGPVSERTRSSRTGLCVRGRRGHWHKLLYQPASCLPLYGTKIKADVLTMRGSRHGGSCTCCASISELRCLCWSSVDQSKTGPHRNLSQCRGSSLVKGCKLVQPVLLGRFNQSASTSRLVSSNYSKRAPKPIAVVLGMHRIREQVNFVAGAGHGDADDAAVLGGLVWLRRRFDQVEQRVILDLRREAAPLVVQVKRG